MRNSISSFLVLVLVLVGVTVVARDNSPPTHLSSEYASSTRPLMTKYCLGCHSTEKQKGELDLERFATVTQVRGDLKVWRKVIEMLEKGEMPPEKKPQPSAEERKRLEQWVRGFIDLEIRTTAGDPGRVALRRLNNAEYNYTVRDLTTVDLQPAREFPADGVAGEGFANAAVALADMSPALLDKYLTAAKEISAHAVLLPDGLRFSPSKTRRDWTDESLAKLRQFYGQFTGDGRLPLQPYLTALVRHRENLLAGKITLEAVATQEKLNPKYVAVLWQTLTNPAKSFPLDQVRSHWRQASEKEVGALVAEISAWQTPLWKLVPIGSYRDGNTTRQLAHDPVAAEAQTLRLNPKPVAGQNEVVLYLVARDFGSSGGVGYAVWQQPRFEGNKQPTLLLRDYAEFGPKYEVDFSAIFADTALYLGAVVEAANDRKLSAEDLAKKHALDAVWLKRWMDVLAVEAMARTTTEPQETGRIVPAVTLALLDEKTPKNDQHPTINGWRAKGADLPVVVSNPTDKEENVPGRVSPHRVTVHPTPTEFVAAVWKSPIAGRVRVDAKIAHAHPACGNGIAWWLESRKPFQATVLAEGTVDLGKTTQTSAKNLQVAVGDTILLAVDAREGNHVCDLTEITLTITETEASARVWNLASDVADNILDANPHADKLGHNEVWSFVKGPTRPVGNSKSTDSPIPSASLLAHWKDAASDAASQEEAGKLAQQLQALFTGARPAGEKNPDRMLYDNLLFVSGPLLQGMDFAHLKKTPSRPTTYALAKEKFGQHPGGAAVDDTSLVVPLNQVIEVRLPAALFRDREFVVEGKLEADGKSRVAQFQILTAPPAAETPWDGKTPLVRSADDSAYKQLLENLAEFRRNFPWYICYPYVIPLDEVVCLKTFHREDEPLTRLFLNAEQTRQIDRLWEEHRFITKFPVVENDYLPLFIGFVTQDQTKEMLAFFEGQRVPFRKRADEFQKEFAAAASQHLESVLGFAARAYRRPLTEAEKKELLSLYQTLRSQEVSQEDAIHGVLARVFVSPSFLYRLEESPPGKFARPVNDWELATRLSYFLWSSLPDDELKRVATTGHLHDPLVLAEQTRRMMKDERLRAFAIEFAGQWLEFRGFDQESEKSETLFPTFKEPLRRAMYEESVRFCEDLFRNDRPVLDILDADYTFLNESLAAHYGIPGVKGPEWRRVAGIKKYSRGGVLGLATILTKQAGASRTSPVLRGNWVLETLLGDKLPKPPPNIPKIPEDETKTDGLTVRQVVEKHRANASCAVCHNKIDPFGFALEGFDPIGRVRDQDLAGRPIDTKVQIGKTISFEGLAGLREYLLTERKEQFLRTFCRKLLGYSLGRSVEFSDEPLIEEMIASVNKGEGRLSSLVQMIVRSPQFRSIRGKDYAIVN